MRKVVIHKPGGYERLVVEEHPDPTAGPGEVLIEVEAIGVNFADCVIRMGLYESAKEYVGWPITPGFEVAGTDAATGERVIGVTRFGGYASKLVVPEHQVFALPEAWTFEQGAGFPTVFLTAWYALFRCAAVERGMTILVHSAAGGVGGAMLQLARIAGVRAIGVVGGAHKVEAALEMGADAVIDKSGEELWPAAERHAPDGYQAVFDANGVATLKQSYDHLAPTGRLVIYGFHTMLSRGRGRPNWLKMAWAFLRTPKFNPIFMTNDNKSVMAFNLSYLFDQRSLLEGAIGQLQAWINEGHIRPSRVTAFPLARVADAHRALESATTVGKMILLGG